MSDPSLLPVLRPRLTRAHPRVIDPDRLARQGARYALRICSADAVIARARRLAARALPAVASQPCGCGPDTLCAQAARAYLDHDLTTFSAHRHPFTGGRPVRLRRTVTGERIAREALCRA